MLVLYLLIAAQTAIFSVEIALICLAWRSSPWTILAALIFTAGATLPWHLPVSATLTIGISTMTGLARLRRFLLRCLATARTKSWAWWSRFGALLARLSAVLQIASLLSMVVGTVSAIIIAGACEYWDCVRIPVDLLLV